MKKSVLLASAAVMIYYFISCDGGKKTEEAPTAAETTAEAATLEYRFMTDLPAVDITASPEDKEGRYVVFDGKTLNGQRGYGRADVPGAWTIEDEAIKINGSGTGETDASNGGDLIFAHRLGSFELEFEWEVGKGSNSGVFIMIQEVEGQPFYISAPEYRVLDNENRPNAKLDKDDSRKSSSLYDIIPAKPQNAKSFSEWNKGKIMCYKGTAVHYLNNDEPVVEHHLWAPQWKEMLDNSKFNGDKWPLAYGLLLNYGDANKEGFIGFQDYGDDVWFRNVTVKVLD